jgi:phosphatidylglycerol lysyltransferase
VWGRWLLIALRIALLCLAAWALRRDLSGLDAADLSRQLHEYGWHALTLGLLCTAGSFVALGVIEVIGLRYAERGDVPPRVVAATSFVANAFSQSIGLALLTGSAVRLRAYARHGLDAAAVARVSAFVTLTVSLGLLATGSGALLASEAPLRLFDLAIPVRPAGAVLGLVVLAYLAWSAFGVREVVNEGAWEIRRPSLPVAVGQLLVSALVCVMPAAVGIGYGTLMRVYLVAQTVGTMSHVPGGAGVFELVMLTLLASVVSPELRAALVASLVMFRVLYYLLPLAVALVVALGAELMPSRGRTFAGGPDVG